jgi:3-hydroxy-3-methylglutaryl CoA synthase
MVNVAENVPPSKLAKVNLASESHPDSQKHISWLVHDIVSK